MATNKAKLKQVVESELRKVNQIITSFTEETPKAQFELACQWKDSLTKVIDVCITRNRW